MKYDSIAVSKETKAEFNALKNERGVNSERLLSEMIKLWKEVKK